LGRIESVIENETINSNAFTLVCKRHDVDFDPASPESFYESLTVRVTPNPQECSLNLQARFVVNAHHRDRMRDITFRFQHAGNASTTKIRSYNNGGFTNILEGTGGDFPHGRSRIYSIRTNQDGFAYKNITLQMERSVHILEGTVTLNDIEPSTSIRGRVALGRYSMDCNNTTPLSPVLQQNIGHENVSIPGLHDTRISPMNLHRSKSTAPLGNMSNSLPTKSKHSWPKKAIAPKANQKVDFKKLEKKLPASNNPSGQQGKTAAPKINPKMDQKGQTPLIN